MKKSLLLSFLLPFATIASEPGKNFTSKLSTNSISFTKNKGQVHDQNMHPRPDVLFSGSTNGMVFHLKNNGISYQLSTIKEWTEIEIPKTKEKKKVPVSSNIYRLDLNWLGINPVIPQALNPLPGHTNYYSEVCPGGATNVNSYKEVVYKNLYQNIDLHYYEKNGLLKYDYVVRPGADYKNIRVQIKGATGILIKSSGELLIVTPLGEITEQAPIVLQNNKMLTSKWILKHNIISFEIGNIDPTQPFIIDPLVRAWGTYYGGSGAETGSYCATDKLGNVFLAGDAPSVTSTVIATSGSHQSSWGGGGIYYGDAYLAKFNSAGVRLWATYYGGSGNDGVLSAATDSQGNVYMAGSTSSSLSTAMATSGSYQPNHAGGYNDAYLVKFNSSGVRLWGTYYGGSGGELGNSCATDSSGNVYLCGSTQSTVSISTSGSHQPLMGGFWDGFLVKFNPSGVRQWATYYGGTSTEEIYCCNTDISGNVFITGFTASGTTTLVATPASHQPVFGGNADGFLAKFNSSGVRQWGTYYGGTGYENTFYCTADSLGSVYLTGFTNTSTGTVIATPGSHQPVFGGGPYDCFFIKFNSAGVRQWGTYYGGSGDERSYFCVKDNYWNIYIGGIVNSATGTVIATSNGPQPGYGGGVWDGFLVKFDSAGVRNWGTYYGGSNYDNAMSGATYGNGIVYISGITLSYGNISTSGSHQPSYGTGEDAYLAKFMECSAPGIPLNMTPLSNLQICNNQTATLSATSNSETINWYPNSFSNIALGTGTTFITPPLASGTYTYYAGAFTCVSGTTRTAITLTVNPNPVISVNSGSICLGQLFTISPTGANSYTFQGGSPIVSPVTSTNYTVIGLSVNGCSSNIVTSSVQVIPLPTLSVNSGTICAGQSFTLIPVGAINYTYSAGSAIVTPGSTSSYTILGQNSAGCTNSVVSTVSVNQLPFLVINGTTQLCAGETATVAVTGGVTYTWSNGTIGPSISVSPTANVIYTVTGTDNPGCVNSATFLVIVDPCTGSETNLIADGIKIFPVPASHALSILVRKECSFELFDNSGRLRLEGNLARGENSIPTTEFAKGIYHLKVFFETEVVSLKVILE
jgi:hypothetical protein